MLRRASLPFVHRGEMRGLPYLESENVARLMSDVRSREMKADIEEQKNDAKLGEQVNRSSSGKKLGANGRHDHAEEEVNQRSGSLLPCATRRRARRPLLHYPC